jgi:transposase
VPNNITLLPLRPTSPELNPTENVWVYLRANKLFSLATDSCEATVTACKAGWHLLVHDPDLIRSIGQRDWACITV